MFKKFSKKLFTLQWLLASDFNKMEEIYFLSYYLENINFQIIMAKRKSFKNRISVKHGKEKNKLS